MDAGEGLAPDALPDGLASMAPGPALSAALSQVDPRRLTAHQLVVLIRARNRQIAFEQAQLLVALRELGHAPPGEREAVVRDTQRNAFATVEGAFGATWTSYRCEQMLSLAEFTLEQVPELGEALTQGRVDLDKVKVFERSLAAVTEPETMRDVVREALRRASTDNTATLRARLQRILTRRDPESIRRRRQRDHDNRFVDRFTEPTGLVSLVARFCDPTAATAAYDYIDAIAKASKSGGDPLQRTIDQLRHDVLLDLLRGVDPAKAGYATPTDRRSTIVLQISLATLLGIRSLLGPAGTDALGPLTHGLTDAGSSAGPGCAMCRAELMELASEPGEIAGYGPVTAHIARETAVQLAQVSHWRYAVDDDGRVIAEGALPASLVPEMVEQMRRWAVDASAGPDGRGHYRPTAAQIAFVRARDQRCQAPGCRVPARKCQVDHRIPWHKGGPTFVDNLFALCKRHHRAKDEAGHSYRPIEGGVEWTSAAGHVYRTLREAMDEHRRLHRHRRRRHQTTRSGCSAVAVGAGISVELVGHAPAASPPTQRR